MNRNLDINLPAYSGAGHAFVAIVDGSIIDLVYERDVCPSAGTDIEVDRTDQPWHLTEVAAALHALEQQHPRATLWFGLCLGRKFIPATVLVTLRKPGETLH